MPRRLLILVLTVGTVGLLAVGCGAKTGLNRPDANDVFDAGTDAAVDASPDADIPCFEVPFDGGPLEVSMEVVAEVGRADVLFLIDTTASMMDEIEQIRVRLRDIIAPELNIAIPDSQIGVATFGDFPVGGYGMADQDDPFTLMLPMTDDLARAQAAVNAIRLGNGMDEPESQVEALYQLATGEGFDRFVPASAGCPSGGIGYACFRRDALPVVLLFTDASMHNGPDGANAYGADLVPPPHSYPQAVDALQGLGAVVIGFDSGGGAGSPHLRRVARDTGAVVGGEPLVFRINRNGDGLSDEVVGAVRTFASNIVIDIDVVASDPDRGDGVDVLDFIDRIEPLSASPASGVGSIDVPGGVFRDVVAGTRVTFQIVLNNDAVVAGTEPKSFRLELFFRGDGRTRLARRLIDIVIPAADGAGCDDLI